MADSPAPDEFARITDVIRAHPHGLSIKEIAAAVSMSRNSVAKYLDVLTASGQLELRHVGNAKLYMLSPMVPAGDISGLPKELIVILDHELRIVHAGGLFLEFIGMAREKILHAPLSSLPYPFLSAAEEGEMAALLRGGAPWKKEIRIVRDGSEIFFSGRFLPAMLEDGRPGITLILVDTTKRVTAEKSTAEYNRLLHTIFQIPDSPRFFIDRNHKVVFWDRALEILTGVRMEEVVGTDMHWKAFSSHPRPCLVDLILDGDLEKISRLYPGKKTTISVTSGRYECTGFFPALGTRGTWLHITAVVIRDTAGNVTGAMETVEDVTDRKSREFIVGT